MRYVKPDFWTSRSLSRVSEGARLTFIGLFNHVDDAGRCYDEPALIKAAVFPLRDEITRQVVIDRLDELASVGAVCRYEIDGSQYLHVPAFLKHQRIEKATRSDHPGCPVHDRSAPHSGTPVDTSTSRPRAVREPSVTAPRPLVQERSGEERERKGVDTDAPPPAPPHPPTTAEVSWAPEVLDLVAVYEQKCAAADGTKSALLAQEIQTLLGQQADGARLRQAVLDLAVKDYSPRALPKFYKQVRRVTRAASLVQVPSRESTTTQDWAGGF